VAAGTASCLLAASSQPGRSRVAARARKELSTGPGQRGDQSARSIRSPRRLASARPVWLPVSDRFRPACLRPSRQRRSRSSTATNLKAMSEPSPTRSRIADVDVAAPGRPWEAPEDLEAKELRLYALGWGDHLPVELRGRIETNPPAEARTRGAPARGRRAARHDQRGSRCRLVLPSVRGAALISPAGNSTGG
jgi:hypothetical protein